MADQKYFRLFYTLRQYLQWFPKSFKYGDIIPLSNLHFISFSDTCIELHAIERTLFFMFHPYSSKTESLAKVDRRTCIDKYTIYLLGSEVTPSLRFILLTQILTPSKDMFVRLSIIKKIKFEITFVSIHICICICFLFTPGTHRVQVRANRECM